MREEPFYLNQIHKLNQNLDSSMKTECTPHAQEISSLIKTIHNKKKERDVKIPMKNGRSRKAIKRIETKSKTECINQQ